MSDGKTLGQDGTDTQIKQTEPHITKPSTADSPCDSKSQVKSQAHPSLLTTNPTHKRAHMYRTPPAVGARLLRKARVKVQ